MISPIGSCLFTGIVPYLGGGGIGYSGVIYGWGVLGWERVKVWLHYAYKVRNLGRVRPKLRFYVV